jgi:hypothetical protein
MDISTSAKLQEIWTHTNLSNARLDNVIGAVNESLVRQNQEFSHKIIALNDSGLLNIRKLEGKVEVLVQETREW